LKLEPGEWIVQIVRASYSTEDTLVHCLEIICVASPHLFPIGQVAGHDEFVERTEGNGSLQGLNCQDFDGVGVARRVAVGVPVAIAENPTNPPLT